MKSFDELSENERMAIVCNHASTMFSSMFVARQSMVEGKDKFCDEVLKFIVFCGEKEIYFRDLNE